MKGRTRDVHTTAALLESVFIALQAAFLVEIAGIEKTRTTPMSCIDSNSSPVFVFFNKTMRHLRRLAASYQKHSGSSFADS